MRVSVLPLLAVLLAPVLALAEVHTRDVAYQGGGVKMKGQIAWDDKFTGKRPGVLVVHEWWGENDYARQRARMLAELGYVAMAVDMYGDGKVADHPDTAQAYMKAATKDTGLTAARFQAARKVLSADRNVDKARLAAVGYCFGGGVVLNMARRGEPLKGVASFHGALNAWKPARAGDIKARVLVLTGADDAMAPPEVVAAFQREMQIAEADARVISYEGAKHGFTNPAADEVAQRFNMPVAYNAEADKASWAELQSFLTDIFKQP